MGNPWAVGVIIAGIVVGFVGQDIMRRDANDRKKRGIRPYVSARAWWVMGASILLLITGLVIATSTGDLLS